MPNCRTRGENGCPRMRDRTSCVLRRVLELSCEIEYLHGSTIQRLQFNSSGRSRVATRMETSVGFGQYYSVPDMTLNFNFFWTRAQSARVETCLSCIQVLEGSTGFHCTLFFARLPIGLIWSRWLAGHAFSLLLFFCERGAAPAAAWVSSEGRSSYRSYSDLFARQASLSLQAMDACPFSFTVHHHERELWSR